jgi:predicted DNA-binding transcriptional regulator AlpA
LSSPQNLGDNSVVYRNSAHLRARYGVSDMTLWRWQRDEDLGFPQPRWISGRRFWRDDDLARWDATHPIRPGRPAKAHSGTEAA